MLMRRRFWFFNLMLFLRQCFRPDLELSAVSGVFPSRQNGQVGGPLDLSFFIRLLSMLLNVAFDHHLEHSRRGLIKDHLDNVIRFGLSMFGFSRFADLWRR